MPSLKENPEPEEPSETYSESEDACSEPEETDSESGESFSEQELVWNREKLLWTLGVDDVAQDDKRKLYITTNASAEDNYLCERIKEDQKFGQWVAGESNVLAISLPAFGKQQMRFWPLTARLIEHLKDRAKERGDTVDEHRGDVFIFEASPLLDDFKGPKVYETRESYLYRCLSRQILKYIDGDEFTFSRYMEHGKYGPMHIFNSLMRRFEETHQGVLVYFILDGLDYDGSLLGSGGFTMPLEALNAEGKESTVRFKMLLTPPLPSLPKVLFKEPNILDLK
jgi:hypothetical protein